MPLTVLDAGDVIETVGALASAVVNVISDVDVELPAASVEKNLK